MRRADRGVVFHVERAEEVVRTLAGSVSNAKIYPSRHPRVKENADAFLGSVKLFFKTHPGWEWIRIHESQGALFHRGVPLGEGDACADLTERLDARECGGMVLRSCLDEESVMLLLDWLLGRIKGAFPPDAKGVRLLSARAGEASALEAEARENLLSMVPELRVPLEVHEGAVDILDNVMSELRAGRSIDYTQVLAISERIAAVAMEQDTQLLAGAQLPYSDDYTYNHSVNVCLIVTCLVRPFVAGEERLRRITEAALLHDVGKCRIPTEILYKKGALTSEEFDIVRRHPEMGARLLLDHAAADPLTVQAAYCHHMRDDGQGYPNPTVPIGPGPVADLIAVADMFEALTAYRPYKKSFSVAAALKILLGTRGMETKKPLVRLLFDRLTCYPPGSEVILDSGERATVVRTFAEAPDRPLVKVTADSDEERVDSPFQVDLRERDNGGYRRSVARVVLEPPGEDEQPVIVSRPDAPSES
ncbi:MAG: HD-GYP domain-containing protein [Planctomycetota bacterium]